MIIIQIDSETIPHRVTVDGHRYYEHVSPLSLHGPIEMKEYKIQHPCLYPTQFERKT